MKNECFLSKKPFTHRFWKITGKYSIKNVYPFMFLSYQTRIHTQKKTKICLFCENSNTLHFLFLRFFSDFQIEGLIAFFPFLSEFFVFIFSIMKVTFQFSGGLELVTETTETVAEIDATEMKMSDIIPYVQNNFVK